MRPRRNKGQATPTAPEYTEVKRKAATGAGVGVILCGEGDSKARQQFLLAAEGEITVRLASAQNGGSHESSYLSSHHHLSSKPKQSHERGQSHWRHGQPGSTTSTELTPDLGLGPQVYRPACQ